MKKYLLLLPVFLLAVTGCGTKKGTISCTLSSNDVINGYSVITKKN